MGKSRSKKSLRDVSRLTGAPLSETIIPSSVLATPEERWVTSPDLTEYNLPYTAEHIGDTALYLLFNPGLTSSVLFRADILAQSGKCPTLAALEAQKQQETEKEASTPAPMTTAQNVKGEEKKEKEPVMEMPAREVPGFELRKTLIRRLIPRNQQLDVPVDQTCHLYQHAGAVEQMKKEKELGKPHSRAPTERFMVIYTPHVSSKEELPYYHPLVRSMAFVYECDYTVESEGPESSSPSLAENPKGTMSIHFLPYENDADSISTRLERSLTKLIEVQIRTTRGRLDPCRPSISSPYALIKDNVIPRNRVQDTYSRLKNKYAADLNERWIESTEPSKHVFEDLSIAAFLIELWRDLYGAVPGDEREQQTQQFLTSEEGSGQFPGFVDIACGNGVLVYILVSEGYSGWGFDARRRKTWAIFPNDIQERLKEEIYIPKPFMDVLAAQDEGPTQNQNQAQLKNQDAPMQLSPSEPQPGESNGSNPGTSISTSLSTLPKDTFIISNHADELTLWTPILSTLLNPTNPPPFLAIPCCSHSLSGARHRFRPQSQVRPSSPSTQNHQKQPGESEPQPQIDEGISEDMKNGKGGEKEKHPETGDLQQLRKDKLAAQNPHSKAFSQSTYGSLTDKLVAIANEVATGSATGTGTAGKAGSEAQNEYKNDAGDTVVVKTLMRIPSTRNIGVIGGISLSESSGPRLAERTSEHGERVKATKEEVLARVTAIVERECARDGGVSLAAMSWVERARKLQNKRGEKSKH